MSSCIFINQISLGEWQGEAGGEREPKEALTLGSNFRRAIKGFK